MIIWVILKSLKKNYLAKRSFVVLNWQKISDKEYDHEIWNENKKDYDESYLKCEVLLLVDVFEKFRNNSLKNYGLCPSHYLSAPVLSWDPMLKMPKIKLELISDPHIYIFLENGTRGGISYICNRYSKANNKYLKYCDPKQESKHFFFFFFFFYHSTNITSTH